MASTSSYLWVYMSCALAVVFQVRSLYVPYGPSIGVHFRKPLVIRLYSEIDQIHLSTEAQCVTTLLPLGDCHSVKYLYLYFKLHRDTVDSC